MDAGVLAVDDVRGTAQAIFDATARFHNPAHAAEWQDAGIDAAFERVWSLVVASLVAKKPWAPLLRPKGL